MPATRPAAPKRAVWLRRKLLGGGAAGSGSAIWNSGRETSSVDFFFRFLTLGGFGGAGWGTAQVEGVVEAACESPGNLEEGKGGCVEDDGRLSDEGFLSKTTRCFHLHSRCFLVARVPATVTYLEKEAAIQKVNRLHLRLKLHGDWDSRAFYD